MNGIRCADHQTEEALALREYADAVGAYLNATTPTDKSAALGVLISTHEWIESHIQEESAHALP